MRAMRDCGPSHHANTGHNHYNDYNDYCNDNNDYSGNCSSLRRVEK